MQGIDRALTKFGKEPGAASITAAPEALKHQKLYLKPP